MKKTSSTNIINFSRVDNINNILNAILDEIIFSPGLGAHNDYTENIVEYERNISSKKDSKNKDNSHLTNKNFLDALKIIDQDSKNQ